MRAQVEFYFSDYNLKRDKRLLEKICKEPRRGYLTVEDVLGLSRVRQLVATGSALYCALEASPYIDLILPEDEEALRQKMKAEKGTNPQGAAKTVSASSAAAKSEKTEDDDSKDKEEGEDEAVQFHPLFVGRARFSPPTEKQFPFRRFVTFTISNAHICEF